MYCIVIVENMQIYLQTAISTFYLATLECKVLYAMVNKCVNVFGVSKHTFIVFLHQHTYFRTFALYYMALI